MGMYFNGEKRSAACLIGIVYQKCLSVLLVSSNEQHLVKVIFATIHNKDTADIVRFLTINQLNT